MAARNLEADALEQLGYQQESSTFRNAYLLGAFELRTGATIVNLRRSLPFYLGMPETSLFDALAASLNGPKADNMVLKINWMFTDSGNKYLLTLENSVLSHFKDRTGNAVHLAIASDKLSFLRLAFLRVPLEEVISSGQLKIEGDKGELAAFLELFDTTDGRFNVVLP
jgi:alkyl sulfatase BDS1-like metallo-beta-lactamase superfamily hydrolase